jgi:hypothetical protein
LPDNNYILRLNDHCALIGICRCGDLQKEKKNNQRLINRIHLDTLQFLGIDLTMDLFNSLVSHKIVIVYDKKARLLAKTELQNGVVRFHWRNKIKLIRKVSEIFAF